MTARRLRWFVLACAAGFGAAAGQGAWAGDFSPQVWLNPGMFSRHFDRDASLRENNTGFGVEVLLADDHGVMAGSFINSDRRRTRYALYQWRPLHWQVSALKVSAGVALAAMDGYPKYRGGAWFAAPLPVLSVEGERLGVNFAIFPSIPDRLSGAVAIQLKLRVW